MILLGCLFVFTCEVKNKNVNLDDSEIRTNKPGTAVRGERGEVRCYKQIRLREADDCGLTSVQPVSQ